MGSGFLDDVIHWLVCGADGGAAAVRACQSRLWDKVCKELKSSHMFFLLHFYWLVNVGG